MALQQFPQGVMIPDGLPITTTASSGLIDATGEAVATIFTSPINGTITSISFRLTAITTGDNISVEVQSVLTTSAIPSDTQWAAGTGQSFSLTTAMSQSWQTVALSVGAAVSVGDMVALVVKRNDVAGAGNFSVTRLNADGLSPRASTIKALAWAGAAGLVNCIVPHYSGVAAPALINKALPYMVETQVLSAAAAVDEVGTVFNLPFPARVRGFWVQAAATTVNAVTVIRLYNSDGTSVMASSKLDPSQHFDGLLTSSSRFYANFESATVLAANTLYRLSIYASAGTITMPKWSAMDVTAMGSLHMGSFCYATSRADLGVWSENTAARYTLGLIIDQLDDSAASGGAAGGLAHIIGGGL